MVLGWPWRGRWMRRFYSVDGNGPPICEEFKVKLMNNGQTEVTSPDQCEYVLAFCIISTRSGIDLQETMARCPGGKPVILVVLHHSYDPEKFVTPMAEEASNILLSVDILFYQGQMLQCPHNKREFDKILKKVGYPCSMFATPLKLIYRSCYWLGNHKVLVLVVAMVAVTYTIYISKQDGSKKALRMDSPSRWNYLPPVD